MFKFDKIDLQRITVSTIGAAILSTTFVLAAVAPAHADVVVSQVVHTIK